MSSGHQTAGFVSATTSKELASDLAPPYSKAIKPHPWTDETYLYIILCAHPLQIPTHTERKPNKFAHDTVWLQTRLHAWTHECISCRFAQGIIKYQEKEFDNIWHDVNFYKGNANSHFAAINLPRWWPRIVKRIERVRTRGKLERRSTEMGDINHCSCGSSSPGHCHALRRTFPIFGAHWGEGHRPTDLTELPECQKLRHYSLLLPTCAHKKTHRTTRTAKHSRNKEVRLLSKSLEQPGFAVLVAQMYDIMHKKCMGCTMASLRQMYRNKIRSSTEKLAKILLNTLAFNTKSHISGDRVKLTTSSNCLNWQIIYQLALFSSRQTPFEARSARAINLHIVEFSTS